MKDIRNHEVFSRRFNFAGTPVITSVAVYFILFVLFSIFYSLLLIFLFSVVSMILGAIITLAFILLLANSIVLNKFYFDFISDRDVLTIDEYEKLMGEMGSELRKGKPIPPDYHKGVQVFFGFFEFAIFSVYLSLDLVRFLWFFRVLKYAAKNSSRIRKSYKENGGKVGYGFRKLFDEKLKIYVYQPFVAPVKRK